MKALLKSRCLVMMILFCMAACFFQNIQDVQLSGQNRNLPVEEEKSLESSSKKAESNISAIPDSSIQSETAESVQNNDEEIKHDIVIELDPGHGGAQPGAENMDTGTLEKSVNLKIAKFLKTELESYEHVTVFLTREDDVQVELEERVKKAVQDKADVLISLHNNAAGPMADYNYGCTVLTARGVYNKENSQRGQELGCYILKYLSDIGLENQGLMFRICQNKTTYPNGQLCDYYSIIRNSELSGIPGIIIEHCFIDNNEEFGKYLSDDEKIRKLAHADAAGIASYFNLKNKKGGRKLQALHNHVEKITIVSSEDKKDNLYIEKKYFDE